MPDGAPPDQLVIDVDALGNEPLHGGAPADPVAFDIARTAFYASLLEGRPAPACMPDHGVHIYSDHHGRGPCLCKSTRDKGVS